MRDVLNLGTAILFLFFLQLLSAQEKTYQFSNYSVEDGLSQSFAQHIMQDSKGYLWIATTKGLNRFNGKEFEVFMPSGDSTKTSLPHQNIYHTLEATNGDIWIATQNGVSRYDQKTQQFKNWTRQGNCEGCLAGRLIKTLLEDPPFMWIGTSAGLSRIHMETHQVKTWWYTDGTDHIEKLFSIKQIQFLGDNKLLMATDEGLVIYNKTTDRFQYVDEKTGLPEDKVDHIFKDTAGNYWIGFDNKGLAKMEGNWENPRFIEYPIGKPDGLSSGEVKDIIEYPQDHLWISTTNGITVIEPTTNTYRYLTQKKGNINSITNDNINHSFLDSDNRLWLATAAGIDVFDPYLNQFQVIDQINDNINSLSANNTTAVFEDSHGFIWIGNDQKGLTILTKDNDQERYFRIDQAVKHKTGLSSAQVYAINEDLEGRIWVGTDKGIDIIDWSNRNVENYSINSIPSGNIDSKKLPPVRINNITRGPGGEMWLGTNGEGVIVINSKMEARQILYEDQNWELIPRDLVLSLTFGPQNRVWMGNSIWGGSIIHKPGTDTSYTVLKGDKVIKYKPIHDFSFGGKTLLLATTEGVLYFDDFSGLLLKREPDFIQFTEENGLTDNVVRKIIKTKDSVYWLSTGIGISKLNTFSKEVTPFKKVVGARNFQFNNNSGILTRDSIIYFGGLKGLVRFNPYTIKTNTIAPKIYFSNLTIDNHKITVSSKNKKKYTLPVAFPFMESIVMSPRHKAFSIEIDQVNYTLPDETQYAYKLEGFEDSWSHIDQPKITYTNLDPGEYTLIVKAANNDGLWSQEPKTLKIVVNLFWWQTWWAQLLFVSLIVFLGYQFLTFRLKRERTLEQARIQEREKFRERSSRDFHDEAGTKITRISLITELAKLKSKGDDEMQEYLYQIDSNLQDLNSGMRDFIWALDPSQDNIFHTLARFIEFAGQLCEYAGIRFESDTIPKKLKEKPLNMTQRRHLLLILKEALNNSIKYSNAELIELKVRYTARHLSISLKDDGIGFDTAKTPKGNGLKNMKERAKAIDANINVSTQKQKGTNVQIKLPITHLGN